jgi:hypothetical protein
MSEKNQAGGSGHRLERPYLTIVFQRGSVDETGINGCRVEDVLDAIVDKLREYQSGSLACAENEETMDFLELAKLAQLRRRKLRQDQGVFNTQKPHESIFEKRTEDVEEDFSATGA